MGIRYKIIPVTVAGMLIVAPALPAFAAFHERLQERRQERREGLPQNVPEQRPNVQERRQEAKQRLAEKRKQKIRAFFNRMAKRFDAALERQQKFTERISSRIEKARANGRDVLQAQSALDRAKGLWQEAKSALAEVSGKLEVALGAEDPKAAFQEVKALLATVKEKVKAVHSALVDATTALKGIGGGERSAPAPAPVPAPAPAPPPPTP